MTKCVCGHPKEWHEPNELYRSDPEKFVDSRRSGICCKRSCWCSVYKAKEKKQMSHKLKPHKFRESDIIDCCGYLLPNGCICGKPGSDPIHQVEQVKAGLHGKFCLRFSVKDGKYCDKPATVCQGGIYYCDEHDPYRLNDAEEQRISFAYGNAKLANNAVTREMVRDAAFVYGNQGHSHYDDPNFPPGACVVCNKPLSASGESQIPDRWKDEYTTCLEWEGKLQPEFCTTSTVMQLIQELGQAEVSNQSLQQQLREAVVALDIAEDALRTCYNVTDYPANGYTEQDDALRAVRAVIESYRR